MIDNKTLEDQFHGYDFFENVIHVDPGQESIRIDKFIFDKMTNISRNRVQLLIRAKGVTVNDENVKANYKVRPLDVIKIIVPKNPEVPKEIEAQDIPLDIRYEDDYLMVVYKPPGMVVHPGVGNYKDTLVNGIKFHLNNQKIPVLEGNSMDRPGIVHRIDKDTSGLLLIAKEAFTMTHLAKQFFDHTIERKYQAIVWGNMESETGTIDEFIGRDPKDNLRMRVFEDRDIGKHAITHFKVLEDLYYVSLIECQLETGRTHQIRVHMKYFNHPIFNDAKYEGNQIRKGTVFGKYKQFVHNCFKICPRQALHAQSLAFIHPHTKEKMSFVCDLPDDMSEVLVKWRSYLDNRKDKVN